MGNLQGIQPAVHADQGDDRNASNSGFFSVDGGQRMWSFWHPKFSSFIQTHSRRIRQVASIFQSRVDSVARECERGPESIPR